LVNNADEKVFLGVDPGSTNLGYALVRDKKVIFQATVNPSNWSLSKTVETVLESLPAQCQPVLVIERYVAYKGAHNAASEHILMLIGAFVYEFERRGYNVLQFRAIDWKPSICKYLFINEGFRNPSSSFDKKFSIAAAQALSGIILKSNHEADAICLAYKGSILNELV
jgi:hypothetical protein